MLSPDSTGGCFRSKVHKNNCTLSNSRPTRCSPHQFKNVLIGRCFVSVCSWWPQVQNKITYRLTQVWGEQLPISVNTLFRFNITKILCNKERYWSGCIKDKQLMKWSNESRLTVFMFFSLSVSAWLEKICELSVIVASASRGGPECRVPEDYYITVMW